LKHRKYRCDSLEWFFIDRELWGENCLLNRFHSKSFYVLRDITFLWFLFNVVFLTTLFPSQLDLLIL
jgi:hypothetical protein